MASCRRSESELHPLEEGKHAAESGMDLKAYAAAAGNERSTLARKVMAWRVLTVCHVAHDLITDSRRNLAELHAAPQWLWQALVEKMTSEAWTVATTRERVGTSRRREVVPFSRLPRARGRQA